MSLSKIWVDILDAQTAPDAPWDTIVATGIRDNLINLDERMGKDYVRVENHNHDDVNSKATRSTVDWGDAYDGGDIVKDTTGALVKDVYFYDSFTVDAGVILTLSGVGPGTLVIICTDHITINGTIKGNGEGAIGGVAGTSSVPDGGLGGDGRIASGGGGGGSSPGDGGDGGDGLGYGQPNGAVATLASVAGVAGGIGGVAAAGGNGNQVVASLAKVLRKYFGLFNLAQFVYGAGGGGGGDAGGSGATAGGDGGAGIILIAPTININSTAVIQLKGNNAANAAVGGGGGGGGAGGSLISIGNTVTIDGGSTLTLTGGTGGANGAGAGKDGGDGADGRSVEITV